jgi:hypothetical protein
MILGHIRWKEFAEAYLPHTVITLTLAMILGLPEYTLVQSLLQTILVLGSTHLAHVFLHLIPDDSFLYKVSTHRYLHHGKHVDLPRWIELTIEGISNFGYFVWISIAQYILGLELFSNSIILYSGLFYVFVHTWYSIEGNEKHSLHHRYSFCNFEPEIMDAIFDTRCDDRPYTDLMQEIHFPFAAFCLAGLVKLARMH